MPVIPRWWGDNVPRGIVGDRQVPQAPASNSARPPIQIARWLRNGKHPNAEFESRKAEAANQAALYRTKEVFSSPGGFNMALAGLQIPTSAGAGDRARWRFAFHSGPYSHAICCVVTLTSPSSGLTSDTYARLDLGTDPAGAVTQSEVFHYGSSPLANSVIAFGWQYLRTFVKLVEIVPDTDYYATFNDVDNGRLQSACVFDLQSLSENFRGYLPQSFAAMGPILDVYRQNLMTMVSQLWTRGAAHAMWFGVDNGTTPQNTTSTTLRNVIDNSSTTISDATPGLLPDMTGKDRQSNTSGVPIRMVVYGGSHGIGTGGTVTLKDSTGATICSIGPDWNDGIAGWRSTTGFLPASAGKYDLHYAKGTATSFDFYAASVYEYG